jgi:hypothetical protein
MIGLVCLKHTASLLPHPMGELSRECVTEGVFLPAFYTPSVWLTPDGSPIGWGNKYMEAIP